ncbi:hypothetical protein ACQ4PT_048518 [Festuca glaucescens]
MASKMDLRKARDSKGNTALHSAASSGCLESCRFLVEECGIDVNAVSKKGVTPMSYAAHGGNAQAMRYLLDRGADPAIADERGSTPLHNAALQGHYEAVRLLLSKGVPVDPVDHRGTPLHLAASNDHVEVVKVLLEHSADAGADVNAPGYPAPTPLMQAVNDGLTDFVKLLLEAGADPNIPSQAAVSEEERIADFKSRGKEAFAKEDYFTAMYFYDLVTQIDPDDATLFSNKSLCWLRLRNGDQALEEARKCRMIRPNWFKAWYHEGAALSFMKDYEGAADAFQEVLQLDPKMRRSGKP